MRFSIILFSILLLFIFSCSNEKVGPNDQGISGKFISLGPEITNVNFRNDIIESSQVNGLTWDAIYSGGGVGIGDINNDGYSDLYFAGNQVNDALYLNNGDMTFTDISESSGIAEHAGWSSGISMVDINADGLLDIYVSRNSWKMDDDDPDLRRNKLFINNGDNTFSERSAQMGLDHQGYSTQATFLDLDKDGDLDMFLLNTPSNNLKQKVGYSRMGEFPEWVSDQFYINNEGVFENSTKAVGVEAFSFGLGVVAVDIDHDNWVDIYVANDYERPDYMYINQRNGSFKNMLNERIKHTSFTSMGCDAADINNDGLTDIGVVDMQSADHFRSKTNMPTMDEEQFWGYVKKGYNYQYMTNVLQLNNGTGYFSDVAQHSGISSTDWSWSILIADFDNDLNKDIFISNGINKDLRNNDFSAHFTKLNQEKKEIDLLDLSKGLPSSPLANFIFMNQGDLAFKDGSNDLGMNTPSFSFGAAYGDLDNDGDLDLVVNNNNAPPFIYQNELSDNNYLKVRIKGNKKDPFGFGTKVFAYVNGKIIYQELNPVRGYQSSCEPMILLGLGKSKKIDSLICIFPDNKNIVLKNPRINREVELDHISATQKKIKVYDIGPTLFYDQTLTVGIDFIHKEDQYDDWAKEVLLPHSQTRIGPGIAVGDVSGDGLDDFYVCGASGQEGKFFIQQKDGRFNRKTIVNGKKYELIEEVDALIADLDNDGDNDIYLVGGGGAGVSNRQDRIILNMNNRQFEMVDLLPENNYNGSCIRGSDMDNDGDTDLFIGGRGEPLKYPYPGNSTIYRNDEGRFIDVTDEIAKELKNVGMVTDATWSDINADGFEDLIVVGEWMAPTAFLQVNGEFVKDIEWFSNASDHTGWWFHVNTADLNTDGKPDFIIGNIGTNNKFHPSKEKPLKVFSSDFDNNSSNDIVLAKDYKGKTVPTRGKECSTEQLPFIAEEFETFESFANASIENILGDKLEGALVLESKEFRSGIILSGLNGYNFRPFPAEAQISAIMGSAVFDFDLDGIEDIIIAGNLFDAEVETTRHDSGNGLLLKGKEDGSFEVVNVLNSGFYAPTNVREIAMLTNNALPTGWILVGANDNRLTAFTFKK